MNQKTILITGASSGYGKATAELFLERGWNVVATMRKPNPDIFRSKSERLAVAPLDVTDPNSIREAIAETLRKFGPLDVLVNNAGIGARCFPVTAPWRRRPAMPLGTSSAAHPELRRICPHANRCQVWRAPRVRQRDQ